MKASLVQVDEFKGRHQVNVFEVMSLRLIQTVLPIQMPHSFASGILAVALPIMMKESFEYVPQKDDLMLSKKRKQQANGEIQIENAYFHH
ncbi:hypothetical protein A3K79_01095 [Candidatus Bathyarchaeota archaeon RBG_13_46_16b]|nr:MAG: hypothetical protein A3K79_01095 [Candidatus Bathyarchaeota archaeon RBG_13_46_16b]